MKMTETWDGKPIAPEPPFGATVVVFRVRERGPEFLILHRAHQGPTYDGDWAWTPPAGARQPGESIEACARRELYEEAGLSAQIHPVRSNQQDWSVYWAQVAPDDDARLHDAEHDRFEWVPLGEALRRCRPERVAAGIECAAQAIGIATAERVGRSRTGA